MKRLIASCSIALLLLAGCRSEESSEQVFTSEPEPRPAATPTSSVRRPQGKQAQQAFKPAAKVPSSGPALLAQSDIETRLAEWDSKSLPEQNDLQTRSRPFEGSKVVRQKLLQPLPSTTDPAVVRAVEQALTFDPSEPEPVTQARLYRTVRNLLADEEFAALDVLTNALRTKQILQQDGTWMLGFVYRCLGVETGLIMPEPAELAQTKGRFERWLKAHPESLTARYGLASTYLNWAWEARGAGWADSVTEEGWKLFKERLGLTLEVMKKVETQTADPYLPALEIKLGMGLGRPSEEVRRSFDKSIGIESFHVNAAYRSYAYYLLPRWYGSVGDREKFVEESLDRTRSQLGEGLYVVFAESAADMKVDKKRKLRALKDLHVRNPKSFLYAHLYGEQILVVEGLDAARAFYQKAADGKLSLPLNEGERLRLQQRLDDELAVSKPATPAAAVSAVGGGATALGARVGMTREEVEKLLGPPAQVGQYGRSDLEIQYSEGGDKIYSLIVSGDSGRVVSMSGAGAEVQGKEFRRGMSYAELEKTLGKPTEIRKQLYTSEPTFHLMYESLGLNVSWRMSDQKLFVFSVSSDPRSRVGDMPLVTMDEWKKSWKPSGR